ncbi:cytosolic phospholipase A2 zeta [Falco naumanni]|uniref:cytosolic phospholipase A2 zeta n=1 Tax=Falco naumanni TaxID=148594 RepID=UPI001ADEBC34|nr:cytosolic phospholipase A2 zeta [Falco naumanni]
MSVQCCFAALIFLPVLEKPASKVLNWVVCQAQATPLLAAGRQPGPAQSKASDGAGGLQPATAKGPGTLIFCISLSGFQWRQQDVFPMFHEVLRGPLPPRVLPFLAAVLFQRKERKETGFYHWRWEKHPYYNLTVKVLQARNIKGTDLLSKADCYVELKLPTASPKVFRTQVVDNSDNPEWNETFKYRIHSAVKNILELTLYDKDVLVSDELTSVVFDVGGMKLGQPLLRTFRLNPEANEELDVEFYLEKCSDAPTEVLTNGVLVVHPCLSLQGTINKEEKKKEKQQGSCEVKVSVPGAYQKQLCIPWRPDNEKDYGTSFVFHMDKEMCPELQVELEQTISVLQDGMNPDIEKHTTVLGLGTVLVNSLPIGQKVERIISLGEGQSLDMSLKTEESTWDLDIRLGFDLCKEEREFLDKRKKIVSEALRKTLHLKESPPKDEVPVVAVLGSGGGMRALTSFYGSLAGLQQLGLLDAAMYVCGISGSTWCLSTLYQDPNWSQKDLQDAIRRAQGTVSSSKAGAFSPERLKYYFQELNAMEISGRKVSFTDLWGLIVEYFLQQKEDPSKLSDQQEAVKWAQNPYPIYAAVNVRPNISSGDFAEWCEFTPYEVGFRKYGAFVQTEDFDSEFFMGRLIQKRPEPRICFLQGIWGSAFAASLDDICLKVIGIGLGFLDSFKDVIRVVDDCRRFHFRDPTRLKTRLVIPGGPLLQIFQDFFKSRVTCGETFNFMQGLYLHKDYVNIKKFVAWRGTHLDAFPNQLTPMEESLYLVDGGFSINSPFPLVLQPERDVDVILSFNFSWEAPFEVLELTQKYCEEREIPFPRIKLSEEDEKKPKECYMFVDDDNPKAPIVLHFPLVNDTFQKYKAPGVKRESEEEKSFGDFVIESKDSPYRTLNFTFEPYDFNRLVEVTRYNVLNSKDTLFKTLNLALQRRKLKKVINTSNT